MSVFGKTANELPLKVNVLVTQVFPHNKTAGQKPGRFKEPWQAYLGASATLGSGNGLSARVRR